MQRKFKKLVGQAVTIRTNKGVHVGIVEKASAKGVVLRQIPMRSDDRLDAEHVFFGGGFLPYGGMLGLGGVGLGVGVGAFAGAAAGVGIGGGLGGGFGGGFGGGLGYGAGIGAGVGGGYGLGYGGGLGFGPRRLFW